MEIQVSSDGLYHQRKQKQAQEWKNRLNSLRTELDKERSLRLACEQRVETLSKGINSLMELSQSPLVPPTPPNAELLRSPPKLFDKNDKKRKHESPEDKIRRKQARLNAMERTAYKQPVVDISAEEREARHAWLFAILDWTIRWSGRFRHREPLKKAIKGLRKQRYPETTNMGSKQRYRNMEKFLMEDKWSVLSDILHLTPKDIPLAELEAWAFQPEEDKPPIGYDPWKHLRTDEELETLVWPQRENIKTMRNLLDPWIVPNHFSRYTGWQIMNQSYRYNFCGLYGTVVSPGDVLHSLAFEGVTGKALFSLTDEPNLYQDVGDYKWSKVSVRLFTTPSYRIKFEAYLAREIGAYLPFTPEMGLWDVLGAQLFVGYSAGFVCLAGSFHPKDSIAL